MSDIETNRAMTADTCAPPDLRDLVAGLAEDGTRRTFLWQALRTFGWGSLSLTVIPALVEQAQAADGAADGTAPAAAPREVLYGFLVDTTKCIGCGGCMVACQKENNVPDGQFRTWVERYVYYKDGSVQVDMVREAPYAFTQLPPIDPAKVASSFFVPKLCNHCTNTPCIQVCPVGASYLSPEGVVLIDAARCIGCAYCVQACPFGTRFINKVAQIADKCTWCYHRVTKGERPACVEACPTGTRLFGDVNDPDSAISKAIGANRIDVLKSYLGTRPRTRYIGLTAEVV